MQKLINFIFLFSLSIISISGQIATDNKPNTDPEKAQFITSDIALFWRAYDMAKPENNLNVFRDEYLKKGSVGLEEFRKTRIGNVCALVDTISAAPKYYAALRGQTAKVETFKPQMTASFRKLKEIYADAVFPNVYFIVGRMNSAGTLTDKGLLVGVDMFGKTDDLSLAELGGWQKAVVGKIERIPFIVAHESIHYQQKFSLTGGEWSLLGKALNEGGADFIAELIAGEHINPHLHEYGNPREKELWLEFKKEMNGTSAKNWLYQGNEAKDKPADLGYYIGYKIIESYYKKAADKKQAVKDILEIKNFDEFLKLSGYEDKFKS
jgi:hypothetical protein